MLALFALALSAPGPIAFLEDDWDKARATAEQEKKLVAVDVWATWCHTCLSMKNFVLTEDSMKKVADRHVWLALDYDLPKNAAFFASHPITAFPTFLVVDPTSGAVVGRWLGSGTSDEMATFFAGATKDPNDQVAALQRALGAEKFADAVKIADTALATEKNKDRRTQLLAGKIEALWKTDEAACARFGASALGELPDSTPGLDFAASTLDCANALPEAEKKAIAQNVVAQLLASKKRGWKAFAIDDQSNALLTLADAYEATGEAKQADAAVKEGLVLLEGAAKAAKTDAARAVFDAHRLNGYLRFKEWGKAEAMLTASEKAMPDDFNHPWRLAQLDLAKGDYDRGLEAIGRALDKGYGPRKVRLHTTKIDLLIAKKDVAGAKAAIAAARADIQKLDPRLVRQSWLDALDKKAQKLDSGA